HLRGGISDCFPRHVVVADVLDAIPATRNHAPIGPPEENVPALVAPNRKAALVQQPMMMRAQQREVLEARVAAIGPMADVMRVDVMRAITTRERAAPIARPERAFQRRRHRALLA